MQADKAVEQPSRAEAVTRWRADAVQAERAELIHRDRSSNSNTVLARHFARGFQCETFKNGECRPVALRCQSTAALESTSRALGLGRDAAPGFHFNCKSTFRDLRML